MALFARICVLRGFPAAAYRKYAFLSRYAGTENPCACPVKCKAYLTGAALIRTKRAIYELETHGAFFQLWMGTNYI
jgi:hypothetical protein